jgi:hypothetical protein
MARNTVNAVMAVAAAIMLTLIPGCGHSSSKTPSGPAIGGTADDTGAVAWPAPAADQVAQLTTAAGLQLEPEEHLAYHVHAHVDVFIDGQHRTVPGGLGIVLSDPAVHSGTIDGAPAYGGISPPCGQPCISPLHTHDVTGIIHTEAANNRDNTVGQLFTEWNVRFDDNCVDDQCGPATPIAVYVNGVATPLKGAAALSLRNHQEIAIVIGRPPTRIPKTADFSKG